jgi:hypothetical protein
MPTTSKRRARRTAIGNPVSPNPATTTLGFLLRVATAKG